MMVGGWRQSGHFAGLLLGSLRRRFDAILVFKWVYGTSKLVLLHKLLGGLADWSVRSLAVPITPLVILSLGTISRQVLRRRDRDVPCTLWLWVLLGFFADLLIATLGERVRSIFRGNHPQMMLLVVQGAQDGILDCALAVESISFSLYGLFMKYAVFGPLRRADRGGSAACPSGLRCM